MEEKCRNKQKTNKKDKHRQKLTRGWWGRGVRRRSYSEIVRTGWLIYKASLIFKSNIASSIFLKQKELYESQYVAMECRCLKI